MASTGGTDFLSALRLFPERGVGGRRCGFTGDCDRCMNLDDARRCLNDVDELPTDARSEAGDATGFLALGVSSEVTWGWFTWEVEHGSGLTWLISKRVWFKHCFFFGGERCSDLTWPLDAIAAT